MVQISYIAATLFGTDSKGEAAFDDMAVSAQRPPADLVFIRRDGGKRDRVTVFFDHQMLLRQRHLA